MAVIHAHTHTHRAINQLKQVDYYNSNNNNNTHSQTMLDYKG